MGKVYDTYARCVLHAEPLQKETEDSVGNHKNRIYLTVCFPMVYARAIIQQESDIVD